VDTSNKGPAAPSRIPQPVAIRQIDGLDLQGKYYSARIGGDFFDAVATGSRMIFLLTDISGKRGDAHTIAAEVQDTFRRRALEIFGTPWANESESIARLLHDLNASLMSAARGPRYAPTFLGCYNASLAILTYINAGGPPPLLRDSDGTRALECGGVPLGLFSHMTHEPCMQAFESRAQMLIVTKGVIDGGDGRSDFGVAGVQRALQDMNAASAAEICETTLETAHSFVRRSGFLRFNKSETVEDLTAVALVRPDVVRKA
jgi:serine phosphatase RsbU (regulator of sigma subunit)